MGYMIVNIIGIIALLGILFLLSSDRKKINWKMVGVGLVIQLALAAIFVKLPIGQTILLKASDCVQWVINFGSDGLAFVFGSLSDGAAPTGSIFIIQVLGSIIFFSSLVALLNYVGVLGFIIQSIGSVLGKVLGTSKAESFVAVANMFLGQTESPLLVGKYIPKMTKSELMTVLVAGMGSIAGSVLVGYSLLGVPMKYLLLASILVPVGSIVVAKILQPETEESVLDNVKVDRKGEASNLVEAVSIGAINGMQMILSVAASLVAVISLVALVNGILMNFGITLEQILGFIFLPFGLLMGLPFEEVMVAAQLVGQKVVLNEFVAFSSFAEVIDSLSAKAQMMISLSLCGFANISSIAICTSGIGVISPERRKDISQLAFRGMIGGVVVSLLSAMIVGIIF